MGGRHRKPSATPIVLFVIACMGMGSGGIYTLYAFVPPPVAPQQTVLTMPPSTPRNTPELVEPSSLSASPAQKDAPARLAPVTQSTPPPSTSLRPSESATGSPLTTSTSAPLPTTPPAAQRPSASSSAPPPVPPNQPAQPFVDLDCDDFSSQVSAQAKLDENKQDPHNLDADNDGQACEASFPAPKPQPQPQAQHQPVPKAVSTPALCKSLNVNAKPLEACSRIVSAVPGITFVGGREARPSNPTSCHPGGNALDLMTYRNVALGNAIVAYVRANKAELGVTTILWQTAGHYDHVHLSFVPCYN